MVISLKCLKESIVGLSLRPLKSLSRLAEAFLHSTLMDSFTFLRFLQNSEVSFIPVCFVEN